MGGLVVVGRGVGDRLEIEKRDGENLDYIKGFIVLRYQHRFIH